MAFVYLNWYGVLGMLLTQNCSTEVMTKNDSNRHWYIVGSLSKFGTRLRNVILWLSANLLGMWCVHSRKNLAVCNKTFENVGSKCSFILELCLAFCIVFLLLLQWCVICKRNLRQAYKTISLLSSYLFDAFDLVPFVV